MEKDLNLKKEEILKKYQHFNFYEPVLTPNGRKFIKKQPPDSALHAYMGHRTYEPIEQNHVLLIGNGAKIKIGSKKQYVVVDGICVAKHHLPENTMIVSNTSPLGQAILKKGVGEKGFYHDNKEMVSFEIEKIDVPSKAKFVFRNNVVSKEFEKEMSS